MTFAATGHRPNKLGGYSESAFRDLVKIARNHLATSDEHEGIVGMAIGWDQAVAQACVDLCIPFTAAVPFEGQEELWPSGARERYRLLLDAAREVVFVTNRYEMAVPRAMQLRNEWMVDRCQRVVALWDGSFGGTHNCILYARKKKVDVTNLWEKYVEQQRQR